MSLQDRVVLCIKETESLRWQCVVVKQLPGLALVWKPVTSAAVFKLEYFSFRCTMENISHVSLWMVVRLSIESFRHLGISEEVFVITFFHLNFFIVGFCSHNRLFLAAQCIATRKKRVVCHKKMKCQRRLGVKSACSKCTFS